MTAPLEIDPQTEPETLVFDDDGRTPNSRHPVLVYRGLQDKADDDAAERFEATFAACDWPPQWRDGVFAYHHFHSNAHEALAVYAGEAELVLGGEYGRPVRLAAGDVVILPAGTGHCRVSAGADFALTAAYPTGHGDWDLCRPGETDPERARERIAAVPTPSQDPITGADGALIRLWTD
ncbi:cupin domain-containing protein [Salinisphaera sp.]|uniref:cupin domain-containing protein n=1 Tax=Salinisphaera sp. TaxID=1914330 RepID=UPI002D796567|nr:cupin domain-containing protein [Salinisphaera sp.]HET7313575.1 cupin domain-containing protein [Salinisphaera sp.]